MRDKLKAEKRGSKRWWKLSTEIMDKSGKSCSVPALKTPSGWVTDPLGKADLLADTFSSKFGLPDVEINEYSAVRPLRCHHGFVLVRSRHVRRVLEALDANSGTGPDGLAARVLKYCSSELSFPLAKLIRRIVAEGSWPVRWTKHWLMPLYKRKSVYDPENYRAINLTAQISKAAERVFMPHFSPTLESDAFGASQFAYRKKHGSRDAVALYVLSWISFMDSGFKTGVYCSDVSGAFDRVSADRLMQKLSSLNLNQRMLSVIRSWLRDRQGFVIVNGRQSKPMELRNMVFQGTVFGPTLWNAYFGDCVCAVQGCGFQVVIYADDCNAFKPYARTRSNASILEDMRECQDALHSWGRANAVTFDAGKEHFMIVSNVEPYGGPVKLLGIDFDAKLVMHTAVHKCAVKASVKLKTLLRVRRFYNTTDLVMLHKSHILSFVEYRTPGVYHASTSVLAELDRVQEQFVRQLDLSEEDAFMHFNLAPLCVRRDVAILGFIHRAAIRQGPQHLWRFFRLDSCAPPRRSARRDRRHSMHLAEWPGVRHLDIMRRSALGAIRVYNLLPADAVTTNSISDFQTRLTDIVRDRVVASDYRWKHVLSPRCRLFNNHPLIS